MARPRKPDDEKAQRIQLYLSANARRILSKYAGDTHGSKPGVPTLSGLCSDLLEKAALAIAARRSGLRSIDESAGIERGPDGLPSSLRL